ncbi:MAG: PHP domain-containing protein [Syntrophomonadaceae bacterium]|jgi:putative hydrolase|nr:PHP domain-containing protein [Syntrophomonadaceae bacterium]
MNFYGDYHTHSKHSDGRQNEAEIIEAAKEKGLKEIAITDHGPLALGIGIKDTKVLEKMRLRIDALNQLNPDITILLGVEANIRDLDGTLDIPISAMELLDVLIAGLHPYTIPTSVSDGINLYLQNSFRHLGRSQREKAIRNNTKAIVAALDNNPRIDILSHPGLFFYIDVEEVAQACVRNEVLFEINCGHGYPHVSDIMVAKEQGVHFIINSDAHFTATVGQLEYGEEAMKKIDIPPSRIVNLEDKGGYNRWPKRSKGYIH